MRSSLFRIKNSVNAESRGRTWWRRYRGHYWDFCWLCSGSFKKAAPQEGPIKRIRNMYHTLVMCPPLFIIMTPHCGIGIPLLTGILPRGENSGIFLETDSFLGWIFKLRPSPLKRSAVNKSIRIYPEHLIIDMGYLPTPGRTTAAVTSTSRRTIAAMSAHATAAV